MKDSYLVIPLQAKHIEFGIWIVVIVGVLSKHQRVNLCYCASGLDGVLKDTRFILIQAECPYVQFVAVARVISTKKFIVGVTIRRERDRSQISAGKVEWALRARLLLNYVLEVRD